MSRRGHYLGGSTTILCHAVGQESKAAKPAKNRIEIHSLINSRLARYQVRQDALHQILKENKGLLTKLVTLKSTADTLELRDCVANFLVLGRAQGEEVEPTAKRLTAKIIEDVVFAARFLVRQSREGRQRSKRS
jgi:hypothetical protein